MEDKKENKNGPIVEDRISKSEDGKWLIFQTVITTIKPVNYIKKVMEGS